MSSSHRHNDRRGLMVPAVAAILAALGLVLIAAGATLAARGPAASSSPAAPAAPVPARAATAEDGRGPDGEDRQNKKDDNKDGDKKKRNKEKADGDRSGEKAKGTGTVASPVQLVIPRLSIDEPLVKLGFTDTGHVAAPKDYDAPGWFAGGPRPGERGAAIIAGHVDDQDGPAIFYYLSALEAGDTVKVERADGSSISFEVTRVARHPRDEFPVDVFHADDGELRLITCGGEFADGEYTHNVVVYADKE